MVLLSLAIAHANGSLVSAVADEERPQASRPSCPSTVCVASMSRTRGGSAAVCEPGCCSCEPKTIDLPFPDQVPLRSGIASCARVGIAAAQTNANAKTRHLIASSRADGIAVSVWLGLLKDNPSRTFRSGSSMKPARAVVAKTAQRDRDALN